MLHKASAKRLAEIYGGFRQLEYAAHRRRRRVISAMLRLELLSSLSNFFLPTGSKRAVARRWGTAATARAAEQK